jgi:hypothetical protein
MVFNLDENRLARSDGSGLLNNGEKQGVSMSLLQLTQACTCHNITSSKAKLWQQMFQPEAVKTVGINLQFSV